MVAKLKYSWQWHISLFKESQIDEAAIDKELEKHFPTVRKSQGIVGTVTQFLKTKCECSPDNTLYGQSVCSDEINYESGDITDIFTHYWRQVFQLGGLAGIPFTGKTGFGAFAHHIAVGKNLFVLYASHIGVSEEGKLGMYNRKGTGRLKPKANLGLQVLPTGKADSTCGAACGALKHCLCGRDLPALGTPFGDYQMQFIINEVHKHLPRLKEETVEDARQTYLTRVIFSVAKAAAELMVKQNDPPPVEGVHDADDPCAITAEPLHRNVYLLGGIQINMPYPMEDRFVPLAFDVYDPHTKGFNSLLGAAFDGDIEMAAKEWVLNVTLD